MHTAVCGDCQSWQVIDAFKGVCVASEKWQQYVRQATVPCRRSEKLFHTGYCMTLNNIPFFGIQLRILTADNTFRSAGVVHSRIWLCVESIQCIPHHGRTSPAWISNTSLQQHLKDGIFSKQWYFILLVICCKKARHFTSYIICSITALTM